MWVGEQPLGANDGFDGDVVLDVSGPAEVYRKHELVETASDGTGDYRPGRARTRKSDGPGSKTRTPRRRAGCGYAADGAGSVGVRVGPGTEPTRLSHLRRVSQPISSKNAIAAGISAAFGWRPSLSQLSTH